MITGPLAISLLLLFTFFSSLTAAFGVKVSLIFFASSSSIALKCDLTASPILLAASIIDLLSTFNSFAIS